MAESPGLKEGGVFGTLFSERSSNMKVRHSLLPGGRFFPEF